MSMLRSFDRYRTVVAGLVAVLTAALPAVAGETDTTVTIPITRPALPAVGELWEDPDFEETVWLRVADKYDSDFGSPVSLHPEYSQLQAWSSDMSMILLNSRWIITTADLPATAPRHSLSGAYKARWSPKRSEANVLYSMDISGRCIEKHVINTTSWSDSASVARCFPELTTFDNSGANMWEDLIVDDNDDVWTAVQGPKSDGYSYFAAYNITDNRVSAFVKIDRGYPDVQCDHVQVSPGGDYLVLQCAGGTQRFYGQEAFHFVYDNAAQSFTQQPVYAGKVNTANGHGALTVDSAGVQWSVIDNCNNAYLCPDADNTCYIIKSRIPDGYSGSSQPGNCEVTEAEGKTVRLTPFHDSLSGHVSCGNYLYGDWCVWSNYGGGAVVPYQDEIVKIYLDSTLSNPHVDRLAHHRSHADAAPGRDSCSGSCNDYYSQPHATVSPDGTQILFGSNWGNLCDGTVCTPQTPVDPFLIATVPGMNPKLHRFPVNRWVQLSTTAFSAAGSPVAHAPSRWGYSGMWYAGDPAWAVLSFGGGGHGGGRDNDVWRYRTGLQRWEQDYFPDPAAQTSTVGRYPFCSTVTDGTCDQNDDPQGMPFFGANSYCNVSGDATPHSACNPSAEWQPFGATSTGRPWTSHSYDQAAYDRRNKRLIYYGPNFIFGYAYENYYGSPRAFAYDVASRTWSVLPEGISLYHQMGLAEYDPANEVFLALNIGPWVRPGFKHETSPKAWLLDVATDTWSQTTDPPVVPNDANLVWDSVNQRMLAFGSDYSSTNALRASSYPYDSWSLLSPSGTPPPAGAPHAAFDSRNGVLLLIGDGDEGAFVPTYVYDASSSPGSWQRMNPIGGEPVSETGVGANLNYDPVNNVFYLMATDGSGGASVWAYRYAMAGLSDEGQDTGGPGDDQTCNNGIREGSEECDGSDLDGATCASQGYTCGTLSCTTSCTLDRSSCGVGAICISSVAAQSGSTYQVAEGLTDGVLAYTDRGYGYSLVPPSLAGATYIRTANDDKLSQGDTFLSFDVGQPVTVYVAHDDRYATKPAWMNGFSDSGMDLQVDVGFSLFYKNFPAGTVVLGGNVNPAEAEDNGMYTVIIVPQGVGISVPPPPGTPIPS